MIVPELVEGLQVVHGAAVTFAFALRHGSAHGLGLNRLPTEGTDDVALHD